MRPPSKLRKPPGSSIWRASARGATALSSTDVALERWKNVTTIVSAIAIPLILAIVGYFVQRELSVDGLRKDYVAIAAGILKEDASRQEPELRAWATKILDDNSPVPFSQKARSALLTGFPVFVPSSERAPPPKACLEPPTKRRVLQELRRLSNEAELLDHPQLLKRFGEFIDLVAMEERSAMMTSARLECLQNWAQATNQPDAEDRGQAGSPSGKAFGDEKTRSRATGIPPSPEAGVGESNPGSSDAR